MARRLRDGGGERPARFFVVASCPSLLPKACLVLGGGMSGGGPTKQTLASS